MATKKTVAEPIAVPSLRDVSPEYGALLDRRLELMNERDRLEREIRGIRRGKAPASLIADVSERRRVRTAELLGDLVADADDIVVGPKRDEVDDHLGVLRDELEAVEAALTVIAKRLPTVQAMASQMICRQVAEPYKAIVRRLVDSMLDAYEAHAELSEVREQMEHEDVAYVSGLPTPVATPMFGHARARDSRFANWVRTAVETGYLPWSDVPEALK